MTPADETWKPIPGFPGYDASDHGRVRSYRTRCGGEWFISDTPQRVLRSANVDGYRNLNIADTNGDIRSVRVHALVMLAFVGPCPEGMEVCHGNGNGADNNLSNLRYDTHIANMQDAAKSGTMGKVLNKDLVVAIRHLHSNGTTYREIATRLGIRERTARFAGIGRAWKYVGTPYSRGFRQDRKLSDSDILAIRERAQYEKQNDLASEYGVSESMISLIVSGKRRVPTNGNSTEESRAIQNTAPNPQEAIG